MKLRLLPALADLPRQWILQNLLNNVDMTNPKGLLNIEWGVPAPTNSYYAKE